MRTELEVKYDILRGENYRLSKKLDYYESGKAFETLQRKHDEEIRSLKYKLQRSEAAYAVFSDYQPMTLDEWIEIDKSRRDQIEVSITFVQE